MFHQFVYPKFVADIQFQTRPPARQTFLQRRNIAEKKRRFFRVLRVFAVAAGNTASNVVGLNGIGIAQGLQERGYVYTDRSAYLPGQPVHIRGLIRTVANDQFVVPTKKKYRLDVYDARNRVIHNVDVVTGEFGTFHAFFTLPDSAAPGDYRVLACDIDGKTYAGPFRVEHYRIDPVQLTIDVPRTTFYRGEDIEGVIRAKYSYGTPLVGREVRYTFVDGRTQTGTTDDAGEVRFKLPTREFRETQTLQLTAELPERNLHAVSNFLLAVRGFSINIKTVRSVVTAGETFEATFTTKSVDDKPLAEKLKLRVIEKTVVNGRPGEREVEVRDVATTAAEGIGRTTLNLEQGGRYLLRAEGTDRFGNPISATHEVFVSDDSDSVRLRILADKHTYQLGDEANVRVHWREAPAVALVTFQGARILDYRLVRLTTGDNQLKLPFDAKLAPNFRLEISVMSDVPDVAAAKLPDDKKPTKADAAQKEVVEKIVKRPEPRRFHTATADFTVERALTVTLEPKRRNGLKGQPQPGETIDVTVRTVDPQGKPVAAEVGLAMVDRTTFDRFGSSQEPLNLAFRGVTREPAVRTTASIVFAYHPATRPINVRLLSEEERLAMGKLETEARALVLTQNTSQVLESQTGRYMVGVGVNSNAGVVGSIVDDNIQNFAFYVGDERRRGAANEEGQDLARALDAVDQPLNLNQPSGRAYRDGEPMEQAAERAAGPYAQSAPMAAAKPGEVAKKMEKQQALQSNLAFDRQRESERGELESDAKYKRLADANKSNALGLLKNGLLAHGNGVAAAESFRSFARSGGRELTVVENGVQANVYFSDFDDETEANALVRRLRSAGALLLPPSDQQETAYWNPAIVTDAAGTATVAVTLPERSASWKLLAKGITTATLAGDGSGELTVKKDLFGELRLPSVLTDGDKSSIDVAVHDSRPVVAGQKPGPIEVTLKTTIGTKSQTETKQIAVGTALTELSFPVTAALPAAADRAAEDPAANETIQIELTITGNGATDVVRRVIPLRPYGYPVFAGAAGTATSDATAWLEAPAGVDLQRPRLEIVVGAAMHRDLLDVVLGGPTWCDHARQYASPLETTTSDLLAALALQKLVGDTRDQAGPEAVALDARIRAAVGSLASSQSDDGGWSWTGAKGNGNRFASARVLWALSRAKAAAYLVPSDVYDRAVNYLSAQLVAVPDDDLEAKSVVLHALSEAGHGDFAVANRLYRGRTTMSHAAAAYLALALIKLDHTAMAADLLSAALNRAPVAAGADGKAIASAGDASYNAGPSEVRALLGLALTTASPASAELPKIVEQLLAARAGNRWSPEKATGPAVMVLTEWYAKHKPGGERYKLAVVVNNIEVQSLDIDPDAGPQTIVVDPKHLAKGKQHVQFKMTGRGHLTYRCTLGGFVAADKLKNSMPGWVVTRLFEPAQRELDGRELPRGFSIVEGNYDWFRNPLTQLPAGRRGRVELSFWRNQGGESRFDDRLDYLVVREPLPAGTEAVESTILGSFERFERLPGELVFYVGNRRGGGNIRFDVVGTTTGEYLAAPTQLANAHRLEQTAFSKPAKLGVVPATQASVDAYRWSPDELLALGKASFEKRNWPGVRTYLTELLSGWSLRAAPYQETLKMLLDAHLELGPPADVVKYFELVKEKSPDL